MSVTRDGGGSLTVADIFNSAVATWAISAAWELGALDEIHQRGTLNIREFADRNGLDEASTAGMFRALAAVGVVKREQLTVTPTESFAEVTHARSFFHWLARGSAEVFRQMPHLMRCGHRGGGEVIRDPLAIAYACREIDRICYAPTFWAAVKGLGFDYAAVADLGCGNGDRLIELLQFQPTTRGVGIDVADNCVKLAAAEAERAGISDRVSFVQGDIAAMEELPEFADVELVTCFMMGHDLWPRTNCVNVLRWIRDRFPRVRRFLLGDATRTVGSPDHGLPVFVLGFELAHDLMGTFIPSVSDWESVFEPAGWRLVTRHDIDVAVGETIFELEPV